MPNGKPGDHPFTDIILHNWSSEFGEEISNFVRLLASKPNFALVRDEVAHVLEQFSPNWGNEKNLKRRSEALDCLRAIAAKLES